MMKLFLHKTFCPSSCLPIPLSLTHTHTLYLMLFATCVLPMLGTLSVSIQKLYFLYYSSGSCNASRLPNSIYHWMHERTKSKVAISEMYFRRNHKSVWNVSVTAHTLVETSRKGWLGVKYFANSLYEESETKMWAEDKLKGNSRFYSRATLIQRAFPTPFLSTRNKTECVQENGQRFSHNWTAR